MRESDAQSESQAGALRPLNSLECMNQVLLSPSQTQEENSLSERDFRSGRASNLQGASFDDLAHDLRQPLSVIEALAYYLEITSGDQKVCAHLQRIQAMVSQANSILERNQTVPVSFS